jgi:hypothetical protein
MSSLDVRDKFKNFLQAVAPSEKLVDITGEFDEVQEVLEEYGIGSSEPWVGVQFVGADEVPVSLTVTDTSGKYREQGVIFLHIVAIAKLGGQNGIIERGDDLKKKIRGKNIQGILINSVSPPLTGNGATLNFSGGYTAALVQINYTYDTDL